MLAPSLRKEGHPSGGDRGHFWSHHRGRIVNSHIALNIVQERALEFSVCILRISTTGHDDSDTCHRGIHSHAGSCIVLSSLFENDHPRRRITPYPIRTKFSPGESRERNVLAALLFDCPSCSAEGTLSFWNATYKLLCTVGRDDCAEVCSFSSARSATPTGKRTIDCSYVRGSRGCEDCELPTTHLQRRCRLGGTYLFGMSHRDCVKSKVGQKRLGLNRVPKLRPTWSQCIFFWSIQQASIPSGVVGRHALVGVISQREFAVITVSCVEVGKVQKHRRASVQNEQCAQDVTGVRLERGVR